MSTMKDGGPAFPAEITIDRATGEARPSQFNNDDFKVPGMTLRDYFAGQCAIGLLAQRSHHYFGEDGPATLAQDAYMVADAMLSDREMKL